MMHIIGHLDMDAFFAAVEERDKPRLRGRPIVIGADPKDGAGRGVVSTANYEARKYGIHSAMPIQQAWRLSELGRQSGGKETIFIGGNFRKYGVASKEIFNLLEEHAKFVQKVGIDEAYFDLSHAGTYTKAEAIARKIKNSIKKSQKLTASIGIGPNKLIAKIASDKEKPDGLTVVSPNNVEEFLSPLSIRTLPGIGTKTESKLRAKRIFTVNDLQRLSEDSLKALFGKWGASLYKKARGIGSASLEGGGERKSIGEQTTFPQDTKDPVLLNKFASRLAQDVFERFQKSSFTAFRTITITIRFSDFLTRTRSKTFSIPVSDLRTLQFESLHLLAPFFDKRENPGGKLFRLIGVRIENLHKKEHLF